MRAVASPFDLRRTPRHGPKPLLVIAVLAALIASLLCAASSSGAAARSTVTAKAPAVHTVTYDHYSFLVDGKRTYLWSGEFHSFRLPSPDLWLDIFQKMKAAGFNATSLYFDWGYHSPAPGVYDFSGVRDIDRLLDMAAKAGLYVIARPGPYINAEVDGGGFPGWLSTKAGNTRTSDPEYLKYSDQWQTRIDRIIARHQLTTGNGSVIAYQVENEYYNGTDAGRAYMQHMEDLARDDGITVPLTGNNNGTFNSGAAALDVDGADAYPQGFNCSNPSKWNGVPDISYDHVADKPLYTPEFQGGAFDPWAGPGYDQCAKLINDQFASVFYKQNIAVGATAQSFYMTYGGTNWGWLSMPQNYTSYDYGAAIRETRQLDPKYAEEKLLGYFAQAVAPLTKTEAIRAAEPDNAAIVDTARLNPDTGTQFHVLRQGDSTSTSVQNTHISLDFNARPGPVSYTYDDTDPTLQYAGTWSHVANQSYTGGDYQKTESFSPTTGDSLTVPFTGPAVEWIGSKASNHGLADVYIDGVKQDTVDTYGSANQAVLFRAVGLSDAPHTLKIVVTGNRSPSAQGTYVSVDAIDQPPAGGIATYPTVPQEPGTAITLAGRDSDILVADYKLGTNQLQYSTSEIMTDATVGARDIAVLYGEAGSDGETVIRYAAKPEVTVSGGDVKTTWDAATGDLRLNYKHNGLIRVSVQPVAQSGSPHSRPLLLLLADKTTAETFWRLDTGSGPVLVRGTHLLRGAVMHGATLRLSGDNGGDGAIEVFTAARRVTWNGHRVAMSALTAGSRAGSVPAAQPVALPALTGWRHAQESPEADAGFDDSGWAVADKMSSYSTTSPASLPVLFADDYGFHTGNTWYRGRFRATGKEAGIHLASDSGGGAQAFSVWLNGAFLGSATNGSGDFTFPAGSVKTRGDNVVSVLTVNMGHEEDYNASNGNKAARGLVGASLLGAPLTSLTWRLQGVNGGESLTDTTRGPLSTGGLYGERAGWSLPGYPDSSWAPVTLPASDPAPGVSWYRTKVSLDLPRHQDTSLGLTISDDPRRAYRAMIFVNGWETGNYVNYLGPQHSFPVPNGILNPNGTNTIAIAVWNLDGSTGGLGKVALTNYGSYASSLHVGQNRSPGYNRAQYAQPKAPGTDVSLAVPDGVEPGQTFTASTTVSVPPDGSTASRVTATLKAPPGWTVGLPTPTAVGRITRGGSATFGWQVTAPSDSTAKAWPLTTVVTYDQSGKRRTNTDERIVRAIPAPPPAGDVAVSDLAFLSATNGWGPVERDSSVGENQAGDGKTITLGGATFPKGLGTNSVSDVQLYLAGRCSTFTATVGVDDEVGTAGSVTFSVVADGATLTTTSRLTGSSASATVDVPVAGAQVLDLVVGDSGDGNGSDHGDWAIPTLTCA